jgi:hypothetical protein
MKARVQHDADLDLGAAVRFTLGFQPLGTA